MQETAKENKTIAQIVKTDYRTAEVFKKYGINYCCSGNVTLEEACRLKELDTAQINTELTQATRNIAVPNNLRFDEWPLGFLVDYITYVHHAYEEQTLPFLQANLISFANSHKKHHPELEAIVETVLEISRLITLHNKHEDEVLFPYVKQLENMYRKKEVYAYLFVRTMRKPLSDMESVHANAGKLLEKLRELTHDYHLPAKACTNHQVVYHQLKAFDNDLVQHIHLEKNILYPKAKEMEEGLLKKNLDLGGFKDL